MSFEGGLSDRRREDQMSIGMVIDMLFFLFVKEIRGFLRVRESSFYVILMLRFENIHEILLIPSVKRCVSFLLLLTIFVVTLSLEKTYLLYLRIVTEIVHLDLPFVCLCLA